MKLKFNRNFLDFKKDKSYDVNPEGTAKYLVRMRIAKEVVGKDGKPGLIGPNGNIGDSGNPGVPEDGVISDPNLVDTNEEISGTDGLMGINGISDANLAEAKEAEDKIKSIAVEKAKEENPQARETEAAAKIPAAKKEVKATAKKKIVPGIDEDDILGFDL